MSAVQHIQSSFAEGVISPRLEGQIELPSYKTSVKTLENFVVLPQGSIGRRPGTYFALNAASDTADGSRLVSFYYGQGQSYILEFYNNRIRVFSNEGRLLKHDGSAPSDVVTTYTTAQIPELKFTQSADVLYIVHSEHPPRTLSRTIDGSSGIRYSDNTLWTIADIAFEDGPYDEINDDEEKKLAVTKGTYDDIAVGGVGVDTVLDAFVNSSHGLQAGIKVFFTGTVGNLNNVGGTALDLKSTSDPYFVVNPTATTFQIATTSGGTPVAIQLASSATKWTGTLTVKKQIMQKDLSNKVTVTATGSGYTPFVNGDEGRLIRINPLAGTEKDTRGGIRWGYIKITDVDSSTVVRGYAQNDIVLNAATIEHRMSVFNSTDGYPETVQIYQQRLCFGGTTKYPSTVWLSKSGDFYNFSESELVGASTGNFDPTGALILGEQILDDNAMTFTIDSDTVDKVTWMAEGKKLAIGTSGGVFNLYGSENDLTVTPFNFTILKDSAYPSTTAEPVQIGEILCYVQQNKRKIREFKFESDAEEFAALDLTLRAENITYPGLEQIVYQEQPNSLIWGRLANGKLVCLTYNAALQIYAWSTHTIGGSHTDATYGNHAKVESMAVIPHNNRTQLWMIVKRTIGGSTKRHIEFLEKFYDEQETTQVNAHFVDSGLKKYNSSAYTAVSGLTHLEGQALLVYGDGAIQPNQTVSSGAVTLSSSVNTATLGLSYESEVLTLPMMTGPGGGAFAIGKKRMIRVTARLFESIGMKFAMEDGTYEEVIFRAPDDEMGVKVPLFTGDKEMAPISRSFESQGVSLKCDQPFPLTLLLLAMEYEVNI
ncbi:putative tail tubular protein B [uncultured Mediterranean phage uvMED]|nr:putative tail tubular protein B [uncultured Mediterranean phage uvMED]